MSQPVMSVVFPSHESVAPSADLQKSYSLKWSSGLFPRFWLSGQEDSGMMIVKMLMTKAGGICARIHEWPTTDNGMKT